MKLKLIIFIFFSTCQTQSISKAQTPYQLSWFSHNWHALTTSVRAYWNSRDWQTFAKEMANAYK